MTETTDPQTVLIRRWDFQGEPMMSADLCVRGARFSYTHPVPTGMQARPFEPEFRSILADVIRYYPETWRRYDGE